MFSAFFVAAILGAIGYPKTKGLFHKTHYVEAVVFDSAIVQLARLGVVVGALETQLAIELIAETFSDRDWNTQSPEDLFATFDPQDEVDKEPSIPPWVAFSPTMSMGPNSTGLRTMSRVEWETLGSPEMTIMFGSTVSKGLIWGAKHHQEAIAALEDDLGLRGWTRPF